MRRMIRIYNQMHAEIVNQNKMGLYWDMLIISRKHKKVQMYNVQVLVCMSK